MKYRWSWGGLVLLQTPSLPGTVGSFNAFSGFSLTKQRDWASYEGPDSHGSKVESPEPLESVLVRDLL